MISDRDEAERQLLELVRSDAANFTLTISRFNGKWTVAAASGPSNHRLGQGDSFAGAWFAQPAAMTSTDPEPPAKPSPDDPRWTPARPPQPPEPAPEEPAGVPAPDPEVVADPDTSHPAEIPETSPPEIQPKAD